MKTLRHPWLPLFLCVGAPHLQSCVKVESGCHGVTLDPPSYHTRGGTSQKFLARFLQGSGADYQWSATSGAPFDVVPIGTLGDEVRVTFPASGAAYTGKLRISNILDPNISCVALIAVRNPAYISTEINIPMSETYVIVAANASGGQSTSDTTKLVADSNARFYFGFVQRTTSGVFENVLRQYAFEDLGASGPLVPTFETRDTGFTVDGPHPNLPRLAADGAGNGYWIKDGLTLARVRANMTGGTAPDLLVLSHVSPRVVMMAESDLTADREGNVYVIGRYLYTGPDPGPILPRVIRIRNPFGASPVADSVAESIGFTPDYEIAVDAEGRVLVANAIGFRRYLPNHSIDPSFHPPAALVGAVDDLSLDALYEIYVTTHDASGSTLHILDDLGREVHSIHYGPVAGEPLPSVRAMAASEAGSVTLLAVRAASKASLTSTLILVEPEERP